MTKKQSHKIAITGGIGSGKSYVCHLIEQLGYPIFYCDDEAKRILRSDPTVQQALKELVGEDVYDTEGKLNKDLMRNYICQGKTFAEKVDAIVHPRVGEYFETWCERQSTSKVFMECAILFESGFDKYVDEILHVAAPLEVRIERIIKRDHVTREKALGWMSLQMSEEEKSHRADNVIQNDGKKDVAAQIAQFIKD